MFEIKKQNVHRTVETMEQVQKYIAEGYELIKDLNEQKSENFSSVDIDSLNFNNLKTLAKEKKIKGYSTMTKTNLIKALKGLL
jgi:hypothetical protein